MTITSKDLDRAVQAERDRCQLIALKHHDFCRNEALTGGSPDLFERARGAKHIADTIKSGGSA